MTCQRLTLAAHKNLDPIDSHVAKVCTSDATVSSSTRTPGTMTLSEIMILTTTPDQPDTSRTSAPRPR